MIGSMMVVGCETTLPSGAIDLVGLSRSGQILVIEFKTGPQNSDFRHALAQLIDYGADLWGMSYDEFESTVSTRYFASNRCADNELKGKSDLLEAAHSFWPDLTPEESQAFKEGLTTRLGKGDFEYVLVAQRFRSTTLKTIDYLNATSGGSRFFAVELVRFVADGISAFESRTLLRPGRGLVPQIKNADERSALLKTDESYRAVLDRFFEACKGLDLSFEWGSVGTSIRVITSTGVPISVAWWFPPGEMGWMGMTDLTVGYDPISVGRFPELTSFMDEFIGKVKALDRGQFVDKKNVKGYHFSQDSMERNINIFIEILSELTESTRI